MQQLKIVLPLICFVAFCQAHKWSRESINLPNFPKGPHSAAVREGYTMYVSGLHALNAANVSFADETREVLDQMRRLLQAGRMTLQNVAKTTVYLTNWNNYDEMNKIYREYFPENFPARSALQVVRLPANAHVQIEAVAVNFDL
ncbi:unnamed protein product [Ixodes persulcatus]